ncbi:MAG: XRE family transcriptional regulator, partial [Clostridia bacterium]|nr:XRE family transcriptional regulator [Clostridia bacterium]
PECLYLLAMVDYISRENDVPLDLEYDDLRRLRLEAPLYPASVRAMAAASNSDMPLRSAEEASIPEFRRFNIIENEVRNVI